MGQQEGAGTHFTMNCIHLFSSFILPKVHELLGTKQISFSRESGTPELDGKMVARVLRKTQKNLGMRV